MLGEIVKIHSSGEYGTIKSSAAGGAVRYSADSLIPDNHAKVGDSVDFQLGFLNGVAQAIDIKLIARADAKSCCDANAYQPHPLSGKKNEPRQFKNVLTDLHVGIKTIRPKKPASETAKRSEVAPPSRAKERQIPGKTKCLSCDKWMVPRLNIFKGKPEKSFCPFCGSVHRDFRPTLGDHLFQVFWMFVGLLVILSMVVPMFL